MAKVNAAAGTTTLRVMTHKDLPDVLYKYTERRWADAMMQDGTFWIGTLHSFRDIETLGDAIGDADEGTRTLLHDVDRASWPDVRDSPVISKFIDAPPDANIELVNVRFEWKESYADAFVYCVSQVASASLLAPFRADTCVRIKNAPAFFTALTISLYTSGLTEGDVVVAPCKYIGRSHQYYAANIQTAVLLKESTYAYQQEVRALWSPRTDTPIRPRSIVCEDARKYLSIEPLEH